MARVDSYSRMVLWLKVTLPLLALAILSTLFLVAETLDPEAAIPYANVDVGQIMEDQGVTRPVFGGISQDGVEIALGAESVRPDGGAFIGRGLNVDMVFPEGGSLKIDSPAGSIDIAQEEAFLRGGVRLKSSNGYDVSTEEIRTAWSEAVVETAGTVTATGPAGDLEAGRMVLRGGTGRTGHLLVFNDGVRLVYRPKP